MTYQENNLKYQKLNEDLTKATDILYEQIGKELDFNEGNYGLLHMITKGVGRLEGNAGFTIDTEEVEIKQHDFGIEVKFTSNYNHETKMKDIMLSLITIDTMNGKLTVPFRLGGGFSFNSGGEHYVTYLTWQPVKGKEIYAGYMFEGLEIEEVRVSTLKIEKEHAGSSDSFIMFPFAITMPKSKYFTTLYKGGKATITHLTYKGWRNNK